MHVVASLVQTQSNPRKAHIIIRGMSDWAVDKVLCYGQLGYFGFEKPKGW